VALKVVSFAQYLTKAESPWRQDDYHSSKFIKAIKGEPVNGYAYVPVLGVRRELTQQNASEATQWFGEMAAPELAELDLPRPLVFVPIPNSSSTVNSKNPPSTIKLAQAIAGRLKDTNVWDGLRFKVAMKKSRQGGSRDPQEIYDNLTIAKPIPKADIVLIDDVRTTGAHMIAARAKLAGHGGNCLIGVCAGRSTWTQEAQPFSVVTDELEDFTPA